jgi:ornithine decarboxylase
MRIFLSDKSITTFLQYKHQLLSFSSSNRWFFDKFALLNQIKNWDKQLYWIKPYYAIKANPSIEIIKILTKPKIPLNNCIGFDSASINEIKLSLDYIKPNNIIYTNPHMIPHEKEILCSLLKKTSLKVVDTLCEVKKIEEYKIKTDLLIRLISNIHVANVKFDSKFGCDLKEAFEILKYADEHNLKIKGISFHIGSGGDFSRKDAYLKAIEYAEPMLQHLKQKLGNELPILDIGGGVLYDTNLSDALGWTKELPYKIISELGRYYAEPSYHLAVQITAKTSKGVFLDNGIYHELNVYHRDHWSFPKLTYYYDTLSKTIEKIKEYKKITIYGPTCDSYDTINECNFPDVFEVNDWIFMNNMGAYTSAGKVNFNGINSASDNTYFL